jgi:ribosomal protein S18 acetylase RimI-like enzyme
MAAAPASVVVEPAVPLDRAAVVALFVQDLVDLRMDHDEDALGAVYDALLEGPRSLVLVARQTPQGEAVGVLVATHVPSVKFQGWSLWIEELFVDRTARHGGLGRAMVEHLLQIARGEGLKGIDLEAYHGNAPAGLLYRSLGFRRLGRERFFYRFEWEQDQEGEP